MSHAFLLTVLTPERALLSVAGVEKVRLRLADEAWLSIYPHHAPLVAETLGGALQYTTAAESGEIDVAAGILQVKRDEVLVLTSGLLRDVAPEAGPGTEGDLRFDRLAAQLMEALNARPQTNPDAGPVSDADKPTADVSP